MPADRWCLLVLACVLIEAGCAAPDMTLPTTRGSWSTTITVRAPAKGVDGPVLFTVRRTGGIAGDHEELRWLDNDPELGREFGAYLKTVKDDYPAPPSADTFNYQLVFGQRIITWNELSADVPVLFRDLEKWFGKGRPGVL